MATDTDNDQRQDLGDEKAAAEREAEQKRKHEEAVAALQRPMGGMPVSKLRVQITGGGGAGATELPAEAAQVFERDNEVEVTLKGWVKTGKETTETKGGSAVREMVFVISELVSYKAVAPAQMGIGDS